MEKIDLIFKSVAAAAGTVISYMVGGLGLAISVLIGLMAIDFITGLLIGGKAKELDSSIGIRGLIKKVYILLLIGACYLIGLVVPIGDNIGDGVAVAFCVIEFFSVVENGGKLGVPIPQKLKDMMTQLKGGKSNG